MTGTFTVTALWRPEGAAGPGIRAETAEAHADDSLQVFSRNIIVSDHSLSCFFLPVLSCHFQSSVN